jgi:3-deoxy-D-manno-octulosonate 8-phosphate phosphatase (KDO 8-P phosphatase)
LHSDPTTREIWDALDHDVRAAFARVEALVLDVDGVMTDGRVWMSTDGTEAMSFHIRDGSGTWMLHKSGLRVGIVTGRDTGIPEQRAGALKIDDILSGCRDKAAGIRTLAERWGISAQACAFVGDDLLDAPALRAVGLPICVADATAEIHPLALYVTRRRGGRGAVREVAELILEGRGLRDGVLRRYLGDGEPGA